MRFPYARFTVQGTIPNAYALSLPDTGPRVN